MNTPQKTPTGCKFCKSPTLDVSPSGDHLVCPNCERITLLEKLRPPRGREALRRTSLKPAPAPQEPPHLPSPRTPPARPRKK